jgi:hypothetical protein
MALYSAVPRAQQLTVAVAQSAVAGLLNYPDGRESVHTPFVLVLVIENRLCPHAPRPADDDTCPRRRLN